MIELYDQEIAAIAPIWKRLMDEFARRPNNRKNLSDLEKRAKDEFFKAGLVVEVNTIPCLLAKVDPATGRISYGAPEIVVQGRVPGGPRGETIEGWDMFDHELHRAEVLTANERGEKFLGQKERSSL